MCGEGKLGYVSSLIKVPSTPCTSGCAASFASDAWHVSMPRSSIFDIANASILDQFTTVNFAWRDASYWNASPWHCPFRSTVTWVTFTVFASLIFTVSLNHRQYGNSRNLISVSPAMFYLPTFTVASINRLKRYMIHTYIEIYKFHMFLAMFIYKKIYIFTN